MGSEAEFRLLADTLPQLVWVCGPDGELEYVNRRVLEYAGRSFEALKAGVPTGAEVHPDERDRWLAAWRSAAEGAESFELEARLRRADGAYRWHLIRAHAVRGADGAVARWLGTTTDVTDVKEANARDSFLHDLVDELVRLADPQELVLRAMQRLRERTGASRVTLGEVEPDHKQVILLSQDAGADSRIEIANLELAPFAALASGSRAGLTAVVHDTLRGEDAAQLYERWFGPHGIGAIVSAPLLRGGELVAMLSIIEKQPRRWTSCEIELVERVADLVWPALEKMRADREVAAGEARLRLAQSVARVGTWELDADAGSTFLSPETYELLGLDPTDADAARRWLDGVHSEDRTAVTRAIASCRANGTAQLEYRYAHPTLGQRWIYTRAGVAGRGRIAGISLDVTERKQAEEALHELDRRKNEFLAMLAHELRNPLAPISNAAQVLRLHEDALPQLAWVRGIIERQTRHLTRLVDDLLDVSRIVRGQIALRRERVRLAQVVQHAVETVRPLIDERGHTLQITIADEGLEVEGDLTRLSQVIANLLNNAAKYMDSGGTISLEAQRADGEVRLCVRDTGIGMPAPLLPHVFELFRQADRTLDRAQGGLGVGLTLVKRLVELHGGTVEAHSAGEGKGSEFVVRLPAAVPQRAARGARQAARRAPQGAQVARRVLVVDDNVDAAESVAMLLALEGDETRSVHSAQAALAAVTEFEPHVVLLDIGLPGIDGYEVARRIRAQGVRAKLVALTGYGQAEDRARALHAGFDEHLVKPVAPAALRECLERLLPAASPLPPGSSRSPDSSFLS